MLLVGTGADDYPSSFIAYGKRLPKACGDSGQTFLWHVRGEYRQIWCAVSPDGGDVSRPQQQADIRRINGGAFNPDDQFALARLTSFDRLETEPKCPVWSNEGTEFNARQWFCGHATLHHRQLDSEYSVSTVPCRRA
jgi:hypothetical protein